MTGANHFTGRALIDRLGPLHMIVAPNRASRRSPGLQPLLHAMRQIGPLAMLLSAFMFASVAAAHEGHAEKGARPASATASAVGAAEHAGAAMATPEGQMAAAGHAMDEPPPKTFTGRLVNWLGKWHPTVVHFPIALFIVAAALEARAVLFRKPRYADATRLMVGLGALSALAAILLGWMAMGWTYGRYDALHTAHQTLGSAIAILALGTWWAHERWLQRQGRAAGAAYGALLVATVGAIAANGFLGGALVRGLHHLNF